MCEGRQHIHSCSSEGVRVRVGSVRVDSIFTHAAVKV